MSRTHRRSRIATLAACTLLVAAVPASAWTFEIPFSARVNGHQFDRVKAEGDGCKLNVKLWFDAPDDEYASKSKARNYHRFRARITFSNDKVVTSAIFGNSAPGKRVYTIRHDTSADGCWSKQKADVRHIDVEGCRKRGCTPKEFEER